MSLLRRTVVIEPPVRTILESAIEQWRGAQTAWRVIEWNISHDPFVGSLLSSGLFGGESREIRGFTYPGARSIDQPDVDILYEVTEHDIVVHQLEFREANARQAGNA